MPLMSPTKPRQMTDRLIALQIAGTAKAAAQALCAAAMEANNPDLKRLYREYLQEAQSGIESVQTYIADQGWAKPFASPDDQVHVALENADSLFSVKA